LVRGEPFRVGTLVGMTVCVAGVAWLLRQGRAASGTVSAGHGASGVALALLASLLWAGNAVCLKLGASGLSIYQANALRFAFGVLIILPQWLWRRSRETNADAGFALRPMLLPLLADTGFGSVCYVYGLANSELAVGSTLSSLSPLAALALGAITKSETLSLPRVLAVCATVAGVLMLVWS
jgi:drug/metabolite transporter (DMT)-like permease